MSRRSNLVVFVALGCLAFAITLYGSAPGYMSVDSGAQLGQARSLEFRDDHPVAMALIWHFTDRVVPGPLGMLLLMVALYWIGLCTIFGVLGGPILPRAIGLFAVGMYPPAASNLPAVWKDNLMQCALLVGIACLVVPGARGRLLRFSLAALFFLAAIGARHNAAAAVWPFFVMPLLALPALTKVRPWLRWLAAGVVSLAVTLALTIGLGKALAPLATRTEFWQVIPVFDLAGMSLAAGEVLVEPESGVLTTGMGLREIGYKYHPGYSNALYYCLPFAGKRCVPLFRRTLDPDELGHLSSNWLRAIAAHPAAYIAHRAKICSSLLGISGGPKGTYYVDGAPWTPIEREYPLPERVRGILTWIDNRIPSLWFRPWIYAGLCLVLVPLAIFRHVRGASALPLFFALSGLSYTLSFMISAASADYRYTVWTTLCSLLSLATLVLTALASRRNAARRTTDRQDLLASRTELEGSEVPAAAGASCPVEPRAVQARGPCTA